MQRHLWMSCSVQGLLARCAYLGAHNNLLPFCKKKKKKKKIFNASALLTHFSHLNTESEVSQGNSFSCTVNTLFWRRLLKIVSLGMLYSTPIMNNASNSVWMSFRLLNSPPKLIFHVICMSNWSWGIDKSKLPLRMGNPSASTGNCSRLV